MSAKWPIVRLGEFLSQIHSEELVVPSKVYRLIGAHWYAQGLYIKETKLGQEIQSDRVYPLQSGDFVYNRLFAWKGSFAIVEPAADGCYVSSEFPRFRINRGRVDPRFLWAYFRRQSAWAEALNLSSGATPTSRNRLKEALFLNIEIPLPPLEEQRRIVSLIEQLAAQIEEARKLRRAAVEEAGAIVSSVSSHLFEPKHGWRVVPVGEFCEPPQYGYTASAIEESVGPRFLRITDIQDGQVNWSSVPHCRCPNPSKYLLAPGDLVFARTGATTGKSFVIQDCPEAVFASYLIRLRVRDMVSVDYLFRYFQSPGYWEQISNEKKGTGQPNLNGSKLGRLRVPVPPEGEQRRIVAELEALQTQVDALKRLQSETAAELDALLPSILDRAFKGEL